jgi:hypothetical protein
MFIILRHAGLGSISMQAGLRGCGVQMAITIARGGYGATLVDGIRGTTTEEASVFLAGWRKMLVDEIQTNRSGLLHMHCPQIADVVPPNFPELKYINLYLNPLTSTHKQGGEAVAAITVQDPSLALLARFVEDHFLYKDIVSILTRFSTGIFPGLALQELLSMRCEMDLGLQAGTLVMVGKVHGMRKPSGASAGHAQEVHTSLVVPHGVIEAIDNAMVVKWLTPEVATLAERWMDTKLPHLRAWLPYDVLNLVAPIQLPLVTVEEGKRHIFNMFSMWMLC